MTSTALAGCVSTSGPNDQVAFQSTPPGAAVKTSNGLQCNPTPCTIDIARKDNFTATFFKPGYRSANVEVKSQFSGVEPMGLVGKAISMGIGGKFAPTGMIGVGSDAYKGAIYSHTPNPVAVELQPGTRRSLLRHRRSWRKKIAEG